ncbi:MAG: hypothetical protein IJZ68_06140 [Bacteroidaceae bacterium]|nr:hypothetical protein [Bacteroidaceae bacterium]
MARWNPFKQTSEVEGVICDHCGMVYDKVTNRMSEYCECGAHLWTGDPNTRTYIVDESNASPCVCKVTSYLLGTITTVEHMYDLEYNVPEQIYI